MKYDYCTESAVRAKVKVPLVVSGLSRSECNARLQVVHSAEILAMAWYSVSGLLISSYLFG
jgi:hypothetical protein